LQGKHEFRSRGFQLERKLSAAKISEHERRAGARGLRDCVNRVVGRGEQAGRARQLEHEHRGEEGDGKPDPGPLPGDGAAILADEPCNRE
jgi:hypothetical protein